MDLQASYNRVADEYIRRIFGELQHKPLDRQLLDHFAASVGDGLVCDMGCGPGHVARYLQERGVRVCGIDLSPEFVERACGLTPGIKFSQGDMMSLDIPDESFAGIVAFYSIIHISRDELLRAFRELKRVLQPGGMLLVSFHIGDDTVHLDEWWDHKVCLDFFFFQPAEIIAYLKSAGFELQKSIERDPYPEVEHQSRRGYVFAQRPKSDNFS